MPDYLDQPETQKQFTEQRAAHARQQAAEQEAQKLREADLARVHAKQQQCLDDAQIVRQEKALRANFFAANPMASEEDFVRLSPQLKDAQMIASTQAQPANVFEKIRAEFDAKQNAEEAARERFNRMIEESRYEG